MSTKPVTARVITLAFISTSSDGKSDNSAPEPFIALQSLLLFFRIFNAMHGHRLVKDALRWSSHPGILINLILLLDCDLNEFSDDNIDFFVNAKILF